MVRLSPRCTPGELARVLGALEVQVSQLHVERRDVALPDYPGGPRPSSVVHVSGAGATGRGEHVAFTDAEHHEFVKAMSNWLRARSGPARVDSAIGVDVSRYGRAALEAALIDLGLRQAGLGLHDLTGVREATLRFVVSLGANPDPLRAIAQVRAEGFTGDLKIDVDPAWNDATLVALAADRSIAIFDFKGRGSPTQATRLAALSGRALFEDPPIEFVHPRGLVSRDATLPDAAAVEAARARGEAVNLKAPRMGGPLEVLRGLDHAGEGTAYIGGMFEVSVGRVQARQLAALYCPSGPNDLAPNRDQSTAQERENCPMLIRHDQPGFGGSES